MKWHLFNYTCRPHAHEFMAPALPAADYGTLLMRGERTREERVLRALEDPVYAEVDRILVGLASLSGMKPRERADVLQNIFGVACDLDAKGGRFQIGLGPSCPVCGSGEMARWEATEPALFAQIDAPGVTHNEWLGLSAPERAARVAAAVGRLGLADNEDTAKMSADRKPRQEMP